MRRKIADQLMPTCPKARSQPRWSVPRVGRINGNGNLAGSGALIHRELAGGHGSIGSGYGNVIRSREATEIEIAGMVGLPVGDGGPLVHQVFILLTIGVESPI